MPQREHDTSEHTATADLYEEHKKLERRVVQLERRVRFLMARLTSNELEQFERVEG